MEQWQVGDPDWGEYWDLCLDRTLAKDWSSQAYRFIIIIIIINTVIIIIIIIGKDWTRGFREASLYQNIRQCPRCHNHKLCTLTITNTIPLKLDFK